MRRHIMILVLAAFALVAMVGPAKAGTKASPEIYTPWNFKPTNVKTITGLVERTDHGLALVTSDGHKYMVTGKDLSNFVGKKVAAKGEISTAGGSGTIAVTSYRTCEYC